MFTIIKYIIKYWMFLQNLFLTVIKTTGTNEGKVFYSMSLGLGQVTLMTVR